MNIQKINEITGKIITLEQRLISLKNELTSEKAYISYGQVLKGFGYTSDTLCSDDLREILESVDKFESEGVDDVRTSVSNFEEDGYQVTEVIITGDRIMTDEMIGINKAIKMGEIYGIEREIDKLKEELKGLLEG